MYYLPSFLLGLTAWGLGIGAIVWPRRRWFSFTSWLACALALLGQLAQVNVLLARADWSALMDTMGAVRFAAAVLTAVTAVLNGIALGRRADRG